MKKCITVYIVLLLVFLSAPKFLQGQWVQTNGPYGGSISGFVAKDSNLFAVSSRIYISSDDGMNWKPVSSQVPNPRLITLAGSNLVVGSSRNGIFLSSDNGANWVSAQGIDSNANVVGFTPIENRLFAAIDTGIFLSTNDGGSWAPVSGPFPTVITAFKAIGTTLFVGTYSSGIFISTDQGVNWIGPDTNSLDAIIKCFAQNDTTIFAAGDRIRRSIDGGKTWKLDTARFSKRWGFVYTFIVKDSSLFIGSFDDGIHRSTDNGKTWIAVNSGLTNTKYINTLFLNDTMIFAGSAAGVFRLTENDSNWQTMNSGIIDIGNNVLETNGAYLFTGTNGGGIFRTSDNGTTWVPVNKELIFSYVQALAATGTDLFAGTTYYDDCLIRTNNNGEDWTVMSLKDESINFININENNILIGNDGGTKYDGIHRSTNGGKTWSAGKGLSSAGFNAITKIGSTHFAGSFGGGVYSSTDNGGSWSKTSLSSRGVRSLAVKEDSLVAGTNEGIFISTDLGNSWTQRNSGLVDTVTRSLLVNGSNLFVGTIYSGIYLSTNDGASWKEINTGLTEMDIRSLKVSGDYLFAATRQGVWRRPLSELVPTAVSPSEKPALFTLEPNRPNPFTNYTNINFTLSERGYVEVEIYDVLGKKIKTLISEMLDAGEHSAEFDAKDLTTGVYVAKLRVNGAEREIKMVRTTN